MSELSDAIKLMVQEKKISQELVLKTIEDTLKATYKRRYGLDDNAEVSFEDDLSAVTLAARKEVISDEAYAAGNNGDDSTKNRNEALYISLSEAQSIAEDAEIGDSLLIEIDPKTFKRTDIQTGKQRAQSAIREIQKDELLQEYRGKVGEIITGYVQSDKDGDLLVDIGKTQGFLPKKNQSPREVYQKGDKILCYVESVKTDEKNDKNIRVLLSRAHENFVRKLFSIYVPELDAKAPSIEIMKIVREPGYRTKVSVYPLKSDADAVGTCVGLKGQRIQSIMNEMSDERIDVIRWDPNPLQYIANALSPAKVENVYVIDQKMKKAIAVVDDSQLSLAIGKQGLNVKLVNRLCDWMVDVKTQQQFSEMEIFQEARANADAMFTELEDNYEELPQQNDEQDVEETEEFLLSELPIDKAVLDILQFHDIYSVEEFINLSEEEIKETLPELSSKQLENINSIISENVDIVEDEQQQDETEVFTCPQCGHPIEVGMTECPNCHVGLSFEEVEETQE